MGAAVREVASQPSPNPTAWLRPQTVDDAGFTVEPDPGSAASSCAAPVRAVIRQTRSTTTGVGYLGDQPARRRGRALRGGCRAAAR
jgi:hypothetical protein